MRVLSRCCSARCPPLQDMGVGLAVVPLMGLVETVAIAKAFGTAPAILLEGGGGGCKGLEGLGASLFPWGRSGGGGQEGPCVGHGQGLGRS